MNTQLLVEMQPTIGKRYRLYSELDEDTSLQTRHIEGPDASTYDLLRTLETLEYMRGTPSLYWRVSSSFRDTTTRGTIVEQSEKRSTQIWTVKRAIPTVIEDEIIPLEVADTVLELKPATTIRSQMKIRNIKKATP
jgi:hypothetical protein